MSLFGGKTTPAYGTTDESVDWSKLKADVIARLDVAAEYTLLGVTFSRATPDVRGRRECHAIGRPDLAPSAFVNVKTGVYHDSGGEGESLHLFAFAVRYGSFGRWIDAVRSYAEKVGVAVGKVELKSQGRTLEARYDYRDEAGEVRYSVFRYVLPNGKKTFTQHPIDGHGGFRLGVGCMDGIHPLPYRLPELIGSDPELDPVYVVEGEKAAEALAALHPMIVATTSHGGTGNTEKTWPNFLDHFRGRNVVVLPDNDPGGRSHATKVCGYLAGVAARIRRVVLPGLPAKGDVVDWLAEGGTLDAFRAVVEAAPDWTPADPAAPAEEDLTTRDATVADLRRTLSADAWLWPGWIPTGALTLLASAGGVGKTRFCFDLHRRLYNGLPWPDGSWHPCPIDQPKVLWIVADNQHREMCDIPEAFGLPDEVVVLNAMASDPYDGTSLQTAEDLADFEARIKRVRPAFVVIDTITNTSDAKAQDSADAKRQYKPLQEIATRCQVPILCVTHLNASGKVLGTRAIEKVRVVIQLEQPDPEGQEHRRKLWVSKSKALKPKALGITMGAKGNEYDDAPPVVPEEGRVDGRKRGPVPTKLKECMDWLATRVNGVPVRVSTIRTDAEAEGYNTKTLYDAMRQLGIVESETEPTGAFGKRYKQWSAPPDPGSG